ncbi:cysteine--tRNA ligase [Candidatus Altiarchaeota archaeon]
MQIRVYNTLTRELEEFKPSNGNNVRAYVCGLTVYADMHIGHARTYIAFDSIFRYLRSRGYPVKYVQNITDIDDKIIDKALAEGVNPAKLTSNYIQRMIEDQEILGLMRPDEYPKVSEYIPQIISAVQSLMDKGHAYPAGGNVYFRVKSFQDYGRLSRQDLDRLTKHRIRLDECKEDPLDFAVWKNVSDDSLSFESPWGRGRPGWHIECSVMAQALLGDEIDIHGGALDLVFPHHENEIAQSQALTGRPFVKYWLHTGFLYSSGEKMSKSLGNIMSVRDFLAEYDADTLRLFVLQTHYRSQINYDKDHILAAGNAVERLRQFKQRLSKATGQQGGRDDRIGEAAEELKRGFHEAMSEDFNTPNALSVLFTKVRKINTLLDEGDQAPGSIRHAREVFSEVTGILGLALDAEADIPDDVLGSIAERDRLRAEKRWDEADKIRDTLSRNGFRLVDGPDGSTRAERA